MPSQDTPVLELEPPLLGCVVIEPELLELPEAPDPLVVEPFELPELPELLELLEPALDAPLDEDDDEDDESLLLTAAAVVAEVCVSPHAPRKRPMVAAATPARNPRRAASRAAGGRRAPPAAIGRGAATCRPAVASVTSPSGWPTQLST